MIGGTGLLGSEAAQILSDAGHSLVSLALAPLPESYTAPERMSLHLHNYLDMSDEALLRLMAGCEAFVFAAGVDERIEFRRPVYPQYERYNIAPIRRLLSLCRQAGIRQAVVLGSYFCHFARLWPEDELGRWHPYIRSRLAQEDLALSFQSEDLSVCVLQLPYIFGAQPGRKPVWVFMVDMIRGMPFATFYPPGGSAMVTLRQTGQAIAGAVLNRAQGAIPVGWHNLEWKQMLAIMHKHLGMPTRKVITIPKWAFRLASGFVTLGQRRRGVEGGLRLWRFADIMCRQLYLDRAPCERLGVQEDDIDAAIGSSMRESLKAMQARGGMVEMRGE